MLDLNELEQLIAFADAGTLSMAAEKLHISQPTITRTMQHLEEVFGVPLFVRGKNKIILNDTGVEAVRYARQLLALAEDALKKVQDFDRKLRTITVSSCAPAPLWHVLPALSSSFHDMTIVSSLKGISELLEELRSGSCQLAILPMEVHLEHHLCVPFLKENLSVCVTPSNVLAQKSSVTFSELNGFNFLLRSEIGFWDEMCRTQMPSSRFLIQNDEYEFSELVKESSLPCFTTNLAGHFDQLLADRIKIPVTNPEANVTYYLLYHERNKMYAASVFKNISH